MSSVPAKVQVVLEAGANYLATIRDFFFDWGSLILGSATLGKFVEETILTVSALRLNGLVVTTSVVLTLSQYFETNGQKEIDGILASARAQLTVPRERIESAQSTLALSNARATFDELMIMPRMPRNIIPVLLAILLALDVAALYAIFTVPNSRAVYFATNLLTLLFAVAMLITIARAWMISVRTRRLNEKLRTLITITEGLRRTMS